MPFYFCFRLSDEHKGKDRPLIISFRRCWGHLCGSWIQTFQPCSSQRPHSVTKGIKLLVNHSSPRSLLFCFQMTVLDSCGSLNPTTFCRKQCFAWTKQHLHVLGGHKGSQAHGLTCVQGQELDLMILGDLFQLEIFYNSIISPGCHSQMCPRTANRGFAYGLSFQEMFKFEVTIKDLPLLLIILRWFYL